MKSERTNTRTHSAGVTLIETVIVIGIFAALLSVIFSMYSGYMRLHTYNKAVLATAGSATIAANDLQDLVLQANRIATSATISGTVYTSDASTLVLELPSIDSSGAALAGKYDFVAFYVSGGKFYRVVSVDPASSRIPRSRTLSEAVTSVTFTYNSAISTANQVTIDMQLSSLSLRQIVTHQLIQKLYVRN